MYEFDPLEPGDPQTVGGYVLRARIGAGGMGRVYLSFTPGGRAVAVKIIRGELASDPEFRERFAREVSIAQQVNGIHIAQLIDSGSDQGVPWLASAYVAGPSLAQVVAAYGPLPPNTVLALAGRIAESLGAIHATGMVHRDLKPGNILLDGSGPKVIDFGIVRAATPTATGRSSHRTFIGSPPFMAPEQIRGQKISPATDVFALGATVYHLCTGESAFQADFADGVLYRVIHDEPDYAACPEEVRELLRACLRKDPAERPGTQRIVDGCRAAGAGPETPLPDAVRAMIQSRAHALAVLAKITGPKGVDAGEEAEARQGRGWEQRPGQGLGQRYRQGREQEPETAAETATAAEGAVPEAGPLVPPVPDEGVPSERIPDQRSTTVVPPPPIAAPGPAPAPPRRRGRAALAAGVSSLVTAVVAVVVAMSLWPRGSTPSANAGKQTEQAATAAAQQSSDAATATATASGPDAVRWQGHVMITINQVDLDSVPVDNGGGSQVSVYDSTTAFESGPYQLSALPYGSMTISVWSGSATPTRSQCYDQVSSQGVEQVTVTNGTMVCVYTAGGRIALVKVLDDQADGGDGILTDVTVWSQVSAGATSSAAG